MLGEIRKAEPGDAAAIATIHVASWRVTYADLLPRRALRQLDVAGLTHRWRTRVVGGGERIRVSERGGRVTGFVTFGETREREDAGFAGEITMLYVDPPLEGMGFGSQLLARAVDEMREAGLYWAVIWAVEGNHTAIEFYQRHGFELDGGRRIDRIGGGRTPLVRLAKPLKARIEIF